MEARVRDIETIGNLRAARESAIEQSRAGRLASLLRSKDHEVGHIYVVKLLDVHPKLGKVAGRRLLDDMGISHFDRVVDLDGRAIEAILAKVDER